MPRSKTLLALTVGPDSVASSRVRTGQVLAWAKDHGYSVRRLSASRPWWPLALGLQVLLRRHDAVIFQKVVPPRQLVWAVRKRAGHLIFELDDAIYLGYPGQDADPRILGRLEYLLSVVDVGVFSNPLLRDDCRVLVPALRAIVQPGPAPESRVVRNSLRSVENIVWLGSPSTIQNVRELVYPAVRDIDGVHLRVVGAPQADVVSNTIQEFVWSPEAERLALAEANAGVMPLLDSEWNVRKAGFKILEYLSAGVIPIVVDSPVVRELLGAQLTILAEVAQDNTPEGWAQAIKLSKRKVVDDIWYLARDEVFERLSVAKLAQAQLPLADSE